jgi:hypothetical protein
MELPYNPAILLLDRTKRIQNRNTNKYLPMNVNAALFTIAKRWKQLRNG